MNAFDQEGSTCTCPKGKKRVLNAFFFFTVFPYSFDLFLFFFFSSILLKSKLRADYFSFCFA